MFVRWGLLGCAAWVGFMGGEDGLCLVEREWVSM